MGSRERRRTRVQGSRAEHDSQLHPRLVTDTAAAGTAPGVAFASVSVAASHFHEETLARLLIKSAFQSATRALQTSLARGCGSLLRIQVRVPPSAVNTVRMVQPNGQPNGDARRQLQPNWITSGMVQVHVVDLFSDLLTH